MSRIFAWLNIRSDESRPVLLLFLFSFFTGSTLIFSYTIAFSLFLSEFEETGFAYVFITAAALSLLVGSIFTRLERVVPPQALFLSTIGLLLATTVLLQIGLWLNTGVWLFWIMMVWYRLYHILTYLAFWGTAGRVLNVEQGKRLFGIIGTGEIIILVIGYAAIPFLVDVIGIENFLIPNAMTLIGSMVMLWLLGPYITRPRTGTVSQENQVTDLISTFTALLSKPYIRSIFALSFLGVISYFVIDYGFYGAVREQFTNSSDLAQFIGYFWMVAYAVSFITRVFITQGLLNRGGLFFGLIFLPAILILFSGALLVSSWIDSRGFYLFVFMILIKMFEDALIITINRTSASLLYQPLPPETTLSAQVVAESLIAPLGLGLAGALLLIINNLPFFNLSWLALVFLIIAGAWIYAAREAFKGYIESLTQALSQRRLQGTLSELNDSASLQVLETYLATDDPRKIVYVLDLMQKVAPGQLAGRIDQYIEHDNDQVARTAVQIVGQQNWSNALPSVKRLAEQQSPVSPEALYTLILLDPAQAVEHATPFLTHDDPNLAGQAILGLLNYGSQDGQLLAADALEEMTRNGSPSARESAAQIIGQIKDGRFTKLLNLLIADDSTNVQKAAMQAYVARHDDSTRGFGSVLQQYEVSPALFNQFVGTLKQAENQAITDDLIHYLLHPNLDIRMSAMDAMASRQFKAVYASQIQLVEEGLQQEGELAIWVVSALADLGTETQTGPLVRSLRDMLTGIRDRQFHLLKYLYDSEILNRIQIDVTTSADVRKRALAIEALVNELKFKHERYVIPLLKTARPSELLELLGQSYAAESGSFETRLKSILSSTTVANTHIPVWVRATALYEIGHQQLSGLGHLLPIHLKEKDPLIKETAQWAMARLN